LNAGKPVLFRTYTAPKNNAPDCTIWEAARATSAAPTFFKRIDIGRPGSRQSYIDGGIGVNNPTAQVLEEAELMFPDRRVSCIISLGTGQKKTNSIPKPGLFQRVVPLGVVKAMVGIVTDCEPISEEMTRRFRNVPNLYFRFSVDQGAQDVSMEKWDQMDKVSAHTQQYMMMEKVDRDIGLAVDALLGCRGMILMSEIGTDIAHGHS
jgi:predicted acylesterase/phospholipase RssA